MTSTITTTTTASSSKSAGRARNAASAVARAHVSAGEAPAYPLYTLNVRPLAMRLGIPHAYALWQKMAAARGATIYRLDIRPRAARFGLRNAYHLSQMMELGSATVNEIWRGDARMIRLTTISHLCWTFRCSPGGLFIAEEREPEADAPIGSKAVASELWMGGMEMVRVRTISKLCEALGVKPGQLFSVEA
jgi:DNA-binding Xre family transcriptional regulator